MAGGDGGAICGAIASTPRGVGDDGGKIS